MGVQRVFLGTATIANGQTTSNVLQARELAMAQGLQFDNAAAYTAAVTVQVAPHDDSAAGAFKALSVGGADVALIAAKSQSISTPGGFGEAIRLVSAGAEGAQRDVGVYALLNLSDG
jgi:hypothetical protein